MTIHRFALVILIGFFLGADATLAAGDEELVASDASEHRPMAISVARAVSPSTPNQPQQLPGLVGTRLDYSTVRIPLHVQLPPFDDAEVADPVIGGPLAIGVHRPVPTQFHGDLASELEWSQLADGAIVTAIALSSPGATSVRVAFVAHLPEGGEIRFFDPARPASSRFPVVAFNDIVIGEDGAPEVLWSPTVDGEAIGVEVTLPSWEGAASFSLTLEKIAHRHRGMSASSRIRPMALECGNHIDVQCRNVDGQDRAVGRLLFEEQGKSWVCTGTLLNVEGALPYFLTANHCVGSRRVASTVEVKWHFQQSTCASSALDERGYTTFGGADLLATSVAQDSTLLLLRGALRPGHIFSGWSARTVTHPTNVFNISHPNGGVKKYAQGSTRNTRDGYIDDFVVEDALIVEWNEGETEGGSSGSGLFDGEFLIGVFSGDGGCGTSKVFGSFQDFYPKIERWLNPSTPTSSPDLVVSSSSVDDDDLRPNERFEFTATVLNRGAARSAATTLRYYQSENIRITARDVEVNTDRVGALDASESGTERERLTAPSTTGTWFYGACVDRVDGEENSDNNCSAGVRVTVSRAASQDDHGDARGRATPVGLNSSTEGSLEEGGDVDYFRFEVPSQGAVVVETTGSTDTYGTLEDAAGREVASNDDGGAGSNFAIERDLDAGTYYVRVRGYRSSTTGDYSLGISHRPAEADDDHSDERVRATRVGRNSSTRGRLERGGDSDYFRFELPSRSTVVIETTGSVDTVGSLEESAGDEVVSNDDGGVDLNFKIERTLEPGTYFVRVSGYSFAVGNYVLRISHRPEGDDHGNTRSSATGVSIPSSTAGTIDPGNDTDYFRFVVPARGTVVMESSGDLDTIGTLFNARGSRIVQDDDGGEDLNFRIERTLDEGTYYVRVHSFRTGTGDYTLHLGGADDHGDSPDEATHVFLPSTTAGIIDPGDDPDFFRFVVSARGAVVMESSGDLDTVGTLFDERGDRIEVDDDGGQDTNFRIERTLGEGTYYVSVRSYWGLPGSYTLHLRGGDDDHGDSPSSATRVSLPSTTTGVIDPGDDTDYFRFVVSARGAVVMESSGDLDTVGTLFDGSGNRIAVDDDDGQDTNFRIERTLDEGTYYVRIQSFWELPGGYTFHLRGGGAVGDDHGNSPSSATRVSLPSTTAGVIDPGNDTDYFRFVVSVRGTVVMESSGELDTVGTLFDARGDRIEVDDDSGQVANFRIARTLDEGTYYVSVQSFWESPGNYTFHLSADDHGNYRSSATRVSLPSSTSGVIDPGNDTDYFRFVVSASGTVVMESSGDLDTIGTLFDASGNRIEQDDDGGEFLNFRIERRLGRGTYYVRVHSYGTDTGAYTLRLRTTGG